MVEFSIFLEVSLLSGRCPFKMLNTACRGGGSDFHAVHWASIRWTRIMHMIPAHSNVPTRAFFRVFIGVNASK